MTDVIRLLRSMTDKSGWTDLNAWSTDTVAEALREGWVRVRAGGPYRNLQITDEGRRAAHRKVEE